MPRLRTLVAAVAAVLALTATTAAVLLTVAHGMPVERADLLWGVSGAAGFGCLGAVVVARRPRLAAGWPMVAVGLCAAGSALSSVVAAVTLPADPGSELGAAAFWLSTWLWVPAYVLVPALLLQVLPHGPLPGRGWRAATGLALVTCVLAPLGWAITPYDQQDVPPPAAYGPVENPVGVDGAWSLVSAALVLLVLSTVAGIASLVVRLRRSAGRERDEVLWVLAGALGTVLLLVLAWVVPAAQLVLVSVALLPILAAVAWALGRGRLDDLDPALARTLVYLSLSLLLLAVYGGLLVVTGTWLGELTGRSDLLVFTVAAVLVQPARDRLQRAVNRLQYGDAVDPVAAVTELGRRVDSAATPSQVLPGVLDLLARTLRLRSAAVHLPGREPVRQGTPPEGAEPMALPLVHQGRTVGRLEVVLPAGGPGPRLQALFDELVRQTAQVAHALLLHDEVQRSRESIVASREEERRRLRQDLHDGLGPGLAATAMQLEAAAEIVPSRPERAVAMLEGAAGYLRGSVAEVRRIVDDLRPAALGDLGLVGAVRAHAVRLSDGGLDVTVSAPEDLGELSAAAEVAGYRILGEAMTNVARHAGARRMEVVIDRVDGQLELCVSDDGVGVRPDAPTGVGLRSMHQRAAELGGSCVVTGGPGTTVRATLPAGTA